MNAIYEHERHLAVSFLFALNLYTLEIQSFWQMRLLETKWEFLFATTVLTWRITTFSSGLLSPIMRKGVPSSPTVEPQLQWTKIAAPASLTNIHDSEKTIDFKCQEMKYLLKYSFQSSYYFQRKWMDCEVFHGAISHLTLFEEKKSRARICDFSFFFSIIFPLPLFSHS